MNGKFPIVAARTALIYLLFSVAWIFISDRFLLRFNLEPTLLTRFQTYKGLAFVTLTSVLLFLGLRAQTLAARQAKAKGQKSEILFTHLLNFSPDAIILLDAEKRINFFNQGAEKIFQYQASEVKGQDLISLIPERQLGSQWKKFDEFVGSTDPYIVMHRIHALRKNGESFPANATITRYRQADQDILMIILRDISEIVDSEEITQHHLSRIRALEQTAIRINADLELAMVLDSICEETAKALNIGTACVVLHDKGRDVIDIAAAYGFPEGLVSKFAPIPFDQLMDSLKGVGTTPLVVNFEQFAGFINQDLYQDLKLSSLLIANLVDGDEYMGSLLTLVRDEPREFKEDDIALMQGLAQHATLALKNAQRFFESQKRLQRLQSLRTIDQTILGSMDLQLSLDLSLQQIVNILEVDAASILLLDPHASELFFVAGKGLSGEFHSRMRLRLGDGIAGRVALERRSIHVPDIAEENKKLRVPLTITRPLKSYFGVPLIVKGQLKGVLEIFGRKDFPNDPEWVNFLETLAGQVAIAIDNSNLFSSLERSNTELALAYDTTLEGWSSALDLRDKETEGHTQRVTRMTLDLARLLGVDEDQLIHMRRGALLHDMGKLGIPDQILLKPGPLTSKEWKIMRKHPIYAHDLLENITYLQPALDIPYCHHEKWDGSGYPRGLQGEQIPLAARIFAVVDVWDALNSARPYRKAWPREKAVAYLQDQTGKHFDPLVVNAFMKMPILDF